jgi:hypothetical protein
VALGLGWVKARVGTGTGREAAGWTDGHNLGVRSQAVYLDASQLSHSQAILRMDNTVADSKGLVYRQPDQKR